MSFPRSSRLACALGAICLSSLAVGCRGGCARGGEPAAAARPAGGALAWFPAETQIVVAIDFARLRATPLWGRLAPLMTSNPDDQAQIAELVRRTGFDPLKQIDSLAIAFPEEARNGGALGLVLRGRGFDEGRLVAYARDHVAKQGDDLFSFRRAGRTMWATRKDPTVAGFFADDRTFVLGAGGWAEKMAELARAGTVSGAEANPVLVHLVERAGVTNPVWAAAIVPAETRAMLAADPALSSGAGVNRMALGVDAASGLRVKLVADLATRQQADAMTRQVGDAVRAAKQSPQVLLMGIGPYLDGVTARTTDVSSEILVTLSATQVADSIERLRAFLALARQGAVPGFPHP
ncbi:MAG: hypothetical protein ABUL77_03605 [Bacteroidota bacterium]